MAETLEDLVLRIGADFSELDRAAPTTQRKVRTMGRQFDESFRRMGRSLTRVTTLMSRWVAGLGAAGAAFLSVRAIISRFDEIDSLAKMADRIGIATEELQGLRSAAKLTGVEARSLDMGLQRMVRRVSEAANDTGEAVDALKELGLEAEALNRLSPDAQFRAIADAMRGVDQQSDRVRLAMKLFDTEGVALVNTLKQGSAALEENTQRLRDMGVAISRVDAGRVEAANDSFTRMQESLSGIAQNIAVDIAEPLQAFAEMISDMVSGWSEMEDGVISFGDVAETVLGAVMDAAQGFSIILIRLQEIANAYQYLQAKISGNTREQRRLLDRGHQLREVYEDITDLAASTELSQRISAIRAERHAEAEERRLAALREQQRVTEETARVNVTASPVADAEKSAAEEEEATHRKLLAERLGRLQDQFKSENQLAMEHFQQQVRLIDEARREQLLTEKEHWDLYMNLHDQVFDAVGEGQQRRVEQDVEAKEAEIARQINHVEKMIGIEQDAVDRSNEIWRAGLQGKAALFSNFFGNISTLMQSESRKQFEIGKVAAISQAGVDTYLAATKAYQAMAGIPVVGPGLGAAAAAAAIAAGTMNINKIRATSFGGGSSGGGGGGGGGIGGIGGAGTEIAAQGGQQSTLFNVTLQGDRFSGNQVRALLGQIGDQLDDNARIMVDG